jgi:hypothetical protein
MGPHELLALNVLFLDFETGAVTHTSSQWTANTSLRVILRYKLYRPFPVDGESSFQAIADFPGLNAYDVRRLVRHGDLHHHLFEEPSPGVVKHSALTKALAEDPNLSNATQNAVEELLPLSNKVRLVIAPLHVAS